MALIDSTQLAAVQDRMLAALSDTGTVDRTEAPVKDARGGRTSGGITTVYQGPCLIETAAPAMLAQVGGALTPSNMHRLKFPVSADVVAGDVVSVGTRRFTVQGIASGSFGLLLVVSALELGAS
jgi:hypothetical protein